MTANPSVTSYIGNTAATALQMAARGHFNNAGFSPQTLIEKSMAAIRDLATAPSGIQYALGASHDGSAALVRNERQAEISGGIA